MIYEVRTYQIQPRSLPEVLRRFEDGYKERRKLSELAAFWYSEIGPLNQIIHVWPYADSAERDRIRAEAAKSPSWPPAIGEFIVSMNSEIFIPAPFSPTLKAGKNGPFYEMRSYTLKPGKMPEMLKSWSEAIEARTKLSPLTIAMHTELGNLNKFVHIWSYKSLDERNAVRDKGRETGVWPPKGGGDRLVAQENKILLPAPFSPAQ